MIPARSLRLLCAACVLAASVSSAASPSPTDGWPKKVAAFIQEARALTLKGDLTGARNAVLRAWLLYASAHYTRIHAGGEPPFYTWLFPRGEALRLFDWNRQTRLVYAEVRGNTFVVPWQARLEMVGSKSQGQNAKKEAAQLPFVRADTQHRIVREWGHRPNGDIALVFYQFHPTVAMLMYGRIDRSGAYSDVNSVGLDRQKSWQTTLLPYRQLTKREYAAEEKAHPQPKGIEPIYLLGARRFVPTHPGSERGHLVWEIPKLPDIPGEAEGPPSRGGHRTPASPAHSPPVPGTCFVSGGHQAAWWDSLAGALIPPPPDAYWADRPSLRRALETAHLC